MQGRKNHDYWPGLYKIPEGEEVGPLAPDCLLHDQAELTLQLVHNRYAGTA